MWIVRAAERAVILAVRGREEQALATRVDSVSSEDQNQMKKQKHNRHLHHIIPAHCVTSSCGDISHDAPLPQVAAVFDYSSISPAHHMAT